MKSPRSGSEMLSNKNKIQLEKYLSGDGYLCIINIQLTFNTAINSCVFSLLSISSPPTTYNLTQFNLWRSAVLLRQALL